MEAAESKSSESGEIKEEYRVQVTSKKEVSEQVNKYKELLKTALDGQPEDFPEETKRVLLQELLANFEVAVQANVLVNGSPWEEAPDDEEVEAIDLESLLDDTIVETTRRRRTFPKKILPHVVHALKAERKVMELYEQTVKPQEVVKDSDQENIMNDLSAAAPGVVKQAIQVIKSINTLQTQAEGLCEILKTKPSQASLEIHREVFGFNDQSEEAAAAEGYVPQAKKPECSVGEGKLE
uniref:NSL1 component of MIS12 kinetochore complex n=1 Tax=Amphilophus citrinellus TaxID=61819 RepID=A0A3Q0SFG0_AMPCI